MLCRNNFPTPMITNAQCNYQLIGLPLLALGGESQPQG
jgi:hypothetical protein